MNVSCPGVNLQKLTHRLNDRPRRTDTRTSRSTGAETSQSSPPVSYEHSAKAERQKSAETRSSAESYERKQFP